MYSPSTTPWTDRSGSTSGTSNFPAREGSGLVLRRSRHRVSNAPRCSQRSSMFPKRPVISGPESQRAGSDQDHVYTHWFAPVARSDDRELYFANLTSVLFHKIICL